MNTGSKFQIPRLVSPESFFLCENYAFFMSYRVSGVLWHIDRWVMLRVRSHTYCAESCCFSASENCNCDFTSTAQYKCELTFTDTLKLHSNRPLYSNTMTGTLSVDVTFGLLHLVQQGGAWAGCGPAQSSPRCTKCNSPSIKSQDSDGSKTTLHTQL